MKLSSVLIASDGETLHQELQSFFRRQGQDVPHSKGIAEKLDWLKTKRLDLAVLLYREDHREAVPEQRGAARKTPVVLALSDGSPDVPLRAVQAAIHEHILDTRTRELPAETPDLFDGERLIGESPSMQDLRTYIRRLSSMDTNVLITGETGTGKELVAELIQKNSLRRQQALVCINCAAIPDSLFESEFFGYERGAFSGAQHSQPGKLELANGGTVFLDEIGDMSLYAQAKILRVIETKEFYRLGGTRPVRLNVRIIAATNQDLDPAVSAAKFRRDLYFRLNVARIHLCPLRERNADILSLSAHYIREFNRLFGQKVEGLAAQTLPVLLKHDWPGNVRELRNLFEAWFVNLAGPKLSLTDLPEPIRRQFTTVADLPLSERDRLLSTLSSTGWNKSKAARQLQWSRMTLYRRMAKHKLNGQSSATL